MATTGQYVRVGLANTYIQNHEASGNLIVTYSRDPKKFPMSRYVKYQPVKKTTGLYLEIKAEEAARIINSNLQDYYWADGADRPKRNEAEEFRYVEYRTKRYDFPWFLGKKAVDEADWPVTNLQQQVAAHKSMTARSIAVASLLQTEGNWDTGHYEAVTSISGVADNWDVSTSDEQNIKRSILYGIEKIQLDTFGMVNTEDLVLVMNPTTARRISTAPEIIDFIKQQQSAPAIIQGKDGGWNGEYGLPKYLHGVEILVESTFRISARAGATSQTKSYVLDDGNAFLLARPGSIEAVAGSGPSFSTVTMFTLEEMTVEQKDDVENRRLLGHVVDDYSVNMTASPSGFWFQSVYDTTSS